MSHSRRVRLDTGGSHTAGWPPCRCGRKWGDALDCYFVVVIEDGLLETVAICPTCGSTGVRIRAIVTGYQPVDIVGAKDWPKEAPMPHLDIVAISDELDVLVPQVGAFGDQLASMRVDVQNLADRYNMLQAAYDQHLRDHSVMDVAQQRAIAQDMQQRLDALRQELHGQ